MLDVGADLRAVLSDWHTARWKGQLLRGIYRGAPVDDGDVISTEPVFRVSSEDAPDSLAPGDILQDVVTEGAIKLGNFKIVEVTQDDRMLELRLERV